MLKDIFRNNPKMLKSNKLKIATQIAAENDAFLIDCFHDDGVIEELVDNRFEIIAGRKGTGKTAIARYLQKEHENYGIDYATRLTLSDLQSEGGAQVDADGLLKYLMVLTAQLLNKKKLLTDEGKSFWDEYLTSHGLQDVTSYREWFAKARTAIEKKSAGIGVSFIGKASGKLSHDENLMYEKQSFNEGTSALVSRLCESIQADRKVVIIIDDITDHLDHPDTQDISKALNQVKYILHQLHYYNTKINDEGVDLTFVCTIRDDLWDFIVGSNENKLIRNSLWLEWNEEGFCKLLIKRLPHFADNLEEALDNPIESIKSVFPDYIFEEVLETKKVDNTEIKQYKTKFYSYVQLISFNRPRDFLSLCHAMKSRLSQIKPIEEKHIKASELEYSVYFYNELKDELNIFSKILSINVNDLLRLMSKLAEKSKMSYTELRSILASQIKASHSNTYKFVSRLWNYSLLGIIRVYAPEVKRDRRAAPRPAPISSSREKDYARFKHNQPRNVGYEFPTEETIKDYYFMLHRGLYWKIQKEHD
jgi:hypothetical protein